MSIEIKIPTYDQTEAIKAASGTVADAESTTGNGTFIAILKRVRTLLDAVFSAVVTIGQAIGTAKAILVAGSDGTNLRAIKTKSDGTVVTELTGSNVADVIFHDAVSAAGNGLIYSVAGYKTLTVEIYGTSTGRQVNFMARGPAGVDRPLTGLRISDLDLVTGTSTTGTAEIWQFDIAGLTSILFPIASVTGGNVSVRGRVVA